jgi:iron(III) transport system ATP-binding protein
MSADNAEHAEMPTASEWRGRAGPVFAGNLAFEDVSYAIHSRNILENVSFSLEAGQIACLLGPSGCGKSTLLKLAAGVLRPRGGRILLDGLEVAGPNRFVPPEMRSVGLMFQDFALFPHMTALENVAFGLTALDRREARRVAELALERVGLHAFSDSYPATLSGGEQQRVALARTIVPRPQVILMDEAFSSLDQRLREAIRQDTLSILKETRATALLVTHDPQEAVEFADRIFLMRKGRIVQSGAPEAIQRQPVDADAARFFRSYNEFSGKVVAGQVETPAGAVRAGTFRNGQDVLVMIPPEDIRLGRGGDEGVAQVIDSRFAGPHTFVRLQLADGGVMVALAGTDGEAPEKGQFCDLALEAKNTHIFAA